MAEGLTAFEGSTGTAIEPMLWADGAIPKLPEEISWEHNCEFGF